jgi:two-component system, OmpR family, response regulator ChvI
MECYFTYRALSYEGFEQALACCFALLNERHSINQLMNDEGMPPLSYRISADYGTVQIAANTNDMFGSTVNLCSKINQLARPNRMVIGGDLYRMVNNSKNYHFTEVGSYKIDKKLQYPVYAVQGGGNSKEAVVTAHISPPFLVPKKNQTRIMIVDDAEDILATYRIYLADTGYSVEAFNDAEEALAEFAKSKQQYALVVLDVRMPRINGLQLFQRMKAIDSKTRIMFVTGLDAIEEIKVMLPSSDKIPIIKKPVNREEFMSKVSTLVNNSYPD